MCFAGSKQKQPACGRLFLQKKERGESAYLNKAKALINVCDTPQARGMPTTSQANTAEPPEPVSVAEAGEELGCGFIIMRI